MDDIFSLFSDFCVSLCFSFHRYEGSQYQCKICQAILYKGQNLLTHITSKHKMGAREYQEIHGALLTLSLSLQCLICREWVDHNERDISSHLDLAHGMGLARYAEMYQLTENKALAQVMVVLTRLKQSDFKLGSSSSLKMKESSAPRVKKDWIAGNPDPSHSLTFKAWYIQWGKLECKICGDNPHKTEESLKAHLRLEHSVFGGLSQANCSSIFSCAICSDNVVGQRANVRRHLLENHDSSLRTYFAEHVRRAAPLKTKPVVCSECNKTFARKSNLYKHYRLVHCKFKPHKCKECNRAFPSRNEMTRHLNCVHLNVKPHQCNICFRTFSRVYGLEDHRTRVHSVQPFKCKECDRTFFSKRALFIHVKSVHFDRHHLHESHLPKRMRSTKCRKCSKTFSNKYTLETHMNSVHLKLKPHACDICDQRFAQKVHLLNHVGKVHSSMEDELIIN